MADAAATTQHLLQAALRYVETSDAARMVAMVREHPEVLQARTAGEGRAVVHAAAAAGHGGLLQLLLDSGAAPDTPEGEPIDDDGTIIYRPGYVPLHHAARGGHEEAVTLLLERGANPSAADNWGGTPMHAARGLRVALALLKAGANANAHCYVRHFDETLGWHFVASPLHVAAQYGDAALIQTLVDHGGRVAVTDGITGRTPLHYAAARGNLATTNRLLRLGADPNAAAEMQEHSSVSRMSPLHYAASEGHTEVVRALLKAGADATARGGTNHETAGMLAAENRHHVIARMLNSVE